MHQQVNKTHVFTHCKLFNSPSVPDTVLGKVDAKLNKALILNSSYLLTKSLRKQKYFNFTF